MTCDDFQIAFERELHGALGEPDRARLMVHLSTCGACRTYQAAARAMEGTMSKSVSQALLQVDWSRVEKGIQRRLLDSLAAVVAAVLGAAFMAGLTWFTATPAFRAEKMLRVGAALAVTVVLIALVMGYAGWALARLNRGEELLAQHRRGLRLRVAFSRAMPWVTAALAGLFAWRAATGDSSRVSDPVFYGVLAALMVGLGLYTRLVKLPRALRERTELDPDRKT
jgi:hypothetical protein